MSKTKKTLKKSKSKKDTHVDPEKVAMEAKVKEWKKELAKN